MVWVTANYDGWKGLEGRAWALAIIAIGLIEPEDGTPVLGSYPCLDVLPTSEAFRVPVRGVLA